VYWQIDVPARVLHVFADLHPRGSYRTETTLHDGDRAPVPGAGAEVPVAELLL
jgi:hypothetical protein